MILRYVLVGIAALVCGEFISWYTTKLINASPDCLKIIDFKLLSFRSAIIVLINVVLWLLVSYYNFLPIISASYMLIASCLLALSVVDFEIFEIPPQFNIIIGIAAVPTVIADLSSWYTHLIGAVCVSGLFLIFTKIKYKGEEMMGGGDVKLMIATGFLLGWVEVLFAMVIGCIIGTVIHFLRMIIEKKEHVLAFGPYLAIATYIMIIWGNDVVMWYLDKVLPGI